MNAKGILYRSILHAKTRDLGTMYQQAKKEGKIVVVEIIKREFERRQKLHKPLAKSESSEDCQVSFARSDSGVGTVDGK